MITYVTRDNLNIEQYDDCISNAVNSRIYGYSWYLDIVTHKQWDALVLDDYAAVMPLPRRRKYFINYVYLVSWSQQLGVFSIATIDTQMVTEFMNAIPRKFKLVDTLLNADSKFEDKNVTTKINYVLPLSASYETLFGNYNKGRKSNVKQALSHNLSIAIDYDYRDIITFFRANKGHEVSKNESDYDVLDTLIAHVISLNLIECVGVVNEEKELIGGAFFLKDGKRITYLFSSVNKEGREKQAMSLALNYIIEKFSNTNYMLDFEGSMIPDIASFFRSFGAIQETYYHYKRYSLFT